MEKSIDIPANPTQQFTRRYLFALGLIAFLFLMSYFLLWTILGEQANYANEISIAGRQNTLSQKIVKTALLIQDCEDEVYCLQWITDFKVMLEAWEKAQNGLQNGDTSLNLNGKNSKIIESLFEKTNAYYYPILKASKKLIDLGKEVYLQENHKKVKAIVMVILANESYYTDLMSEIVILYNAEAQSHVKSLNTIQLFLMIIALLVLFVQVTFIFQPIVKRIELYLEHYQQAHEEAEEKNREITAAYSQLQRVEEITRLNVEALSISNANLMKTQDNLTKTHLELTEKNQELQESYDIIKSNKELEEARFFDNALAHFSNIMRWESNQNIYSWTDNLLSHLVPFIHGLQAIIYAYDSEKDALFPIGGYALDKSFILNYDEIAVGEDLVGQVAKSNKSIYFRDFNGQSSHFATFSATMEVNPRALIVLPLVFNEQIAGVLEMTGVKPFEERHIELLKRMGETIASNLSTLQDQKRINQLFADSQMAEKRLKRSLAKLQENEERFRKLSEVTQEGLLFLNENIIKDTNTVLVKMMGYDSAQELIQSSYINLIAPKYRYEITHNLILNDGLAHETIGIRKDGATFPIEIQSREVKYGNETITVISIRDITERKKTEQQLEEANRIASLVTELEKKNKDITSSIEYAQRIQDAILPTDKLLGRGFLQNFVLYLPKDIVSGDFYWFAEKNEHTLIAAVDCTGHGVPGAFMSIIGYSNLNKIVIEKGITDPDIILNLLDKEVTEVLKQQEGDSQSRDGMDVALCSLNIKEKKLSFAGAYRPLYIIRNGELTEFKGDAFPIGGNFKFKNRKIFTNHEYPLQKGDTVYMFSDGFPDQFGGTANTKYLSKNFKNLLLNIQEHDLEEQKRILHFEFENWRGSYKQMDDIVIIGLRY